MKNIVLLGDSILQGIVIDKATKRYVISDYIDFPSLEKRLNISIKNLSRLGATITYGFKKIKSYLAEANCKVDEVIIEFGGNDCDFLWNEVMSEKSHRYEPKTPLDEFKQTLEDIVYYLKERDIKPVLMTLPPITANKYYNWILRNNLSEENLMYFLGDVERIYRHHEMYNQVIVNIANHDGIELIDVRSQFLKAPNYNEMMCDDGIHIEREGVKIMVNSFIEHYAK